MTAEAPREDAGGPAAPGAATAPIPIRRSTTDRVLAGVCGGIAETYGADPTAVRLLAAIVGVFTGIFPMVILYLIAAVIIPEAEPRVGGAAPVVHRRIEPGQGALLIGLVLIVAGAAALANELLHIEWEIVWPVALIGLGGVVVVMATRR